jgi:uncharacterized protein (DUF58 family)
MARTTDPSPRRRYHFHLPGVVYVGVTVFLAIGALNSQNNLLFVALGLAIGGLLVSGIVSGISLMGIELERVQASDTAVGRPLVIVYSVRNRNRFMPAFGLTVCEVGGGEPEATWPRVLNGAPCAHIAHVGPGQRLHTEAVAWAHSRGRIMLSAVQVWSTFPFGIAKKSVTFLLPQTVVVRPLVVPLRAGLVSDRRRKVERGAAAGRFAGPGDEFWALREYTPGDPPRQIAWRATARTGQILVTQRAAPTPARAWVVLRLSAGADPSMNERAVCLAASLIERAIGDHMSIGLSVPDQGLLCSPEVHRRHAERLQNELAGVEPPPPGAVPEFPAMAARSGACIIVWAGTPEQGWGPPGARHLMAADSARLIADPAMAARVDRLGMPEAPAGWTARLTGPLVAMVRRGRQGAEG